MPDSLDPVDVNVRLSTLEVEMKHTNSALEKNSEALDSITGKVDSINLYIQKQNGAIPHMQSDLSELKSHLYAFTTKYFETSLAETKEAVQSNTKLKIVWSVFGILGTAILGFVAKMLLG